MAGGLYDIESGTELAPEEVSQAFAEGRLGVDGSQPLIVTNETGRRVEVKASDRMGEELGKLLTQGFRLETPEETRQVELEKEGERHPYLGIAEAGLRGVTLGLSTPLLDAALGPEYTERAASRRDALEGFGTIAEVGGAVIPAIASGGALGYTPAGLLARGAESAGAALERNLLARGVGAGVSKVVGLAAEGTIDGAVSSVGAEISEATLGDIEVTAERLLAAGGIGALLGLGGGAGAGALGVGARKGARAIADRRAAKLAGKVDDGLESMAVPSMADEIGAKDAGYFEILPDSIVEKVGVATQDPEIVTAAIRDKNFRAAILNRDSVKNSLNKRLREDLQASLDTDHLTKKLFAGDPKTHNVYNDVPNNLKAGEKARADFEAIVADYYHGLDQLNAKGWLQPKQYDNLRKELDYTRDLVNKGFSPDGHNAESFLAIENFKRSADARRKRITNAERKRGFNFGEGETSPQLKAMSAELGDRLRKHLENREFYGEAARKQAERNAAGHSVFSTNQGFLQKLVKNTGEGLGPEDWDVEYRVIDGTKADSFLEDLLDPNKEFDVDQVRRNLVAREKLLDTIQKNGEVPDYFHEDEFLKAQSDIKRAIGTLDEAKEMLGKIGRFETVEKAGAELSKLSSPASTVGQWIGGGIGGALGGFAGAGVGGAIGSTLPKLLGLAVNPAELVKTVGRLEALAQRSNTVQTTVRDRTSAAVSQLAKPRAERRVAGRISRSVVRGAVQDRASEREKARKVEKRISELTKDPMRVVDALAYQSRSVSRVAPATTAAYQRQSLKALEFLRSKLPPASRTPNTIQPHLNKSLWDAKTVDKFSRYLEVISDPTRAITALERGKLSEEHVEVLKAVYPTLYQEMRTAASEEISRHGDEFPYDSVVQLSLLLDIPGHPTMSPEFQTTLKTIREKVAKDAEQSIPPPSRQKPISVPKSFVDRLSGGLQ